MSEPSPYFTAGGFNPPPPPAPAATPTPPPSGDYISRADLEAILAARDAQHAAEMEAVRNQLPTLVVPANGGGPGNDNHQASWSLAEQEAAQRGETLSTWKV